MTLMSSNCTSACCLSQFFQRRPGERRMLGSARESVNTLLLHSPAGVFELCSAGTSVVLVLLVAASWAPVSSSLSPADSSSEDSLKKKKGEKTPQLRVGQQVEEGGNPESKDHALIPTVVGVNTVTTSL